MRRSCIRRIFEPFSPDTTPAHMYGAFGWSYMHPQGMDFPRTHNRVASPPFMGRQVNAFRSVWIDTEIHPVFRVALDAYLKKLPLTRFVPNTPAEEAISDYKQVAPLVQDIRSRHGWLAKVAQLCGIHKKGALVLPLWSAECHAMYVEHDEVPPTSLVRAMLYCCSRSRLPEWRGFFDCCLKDKWNATPGFEAQLWGRLLKCAGQLDDERGVVAILKEAVDVQADFSHFSHASYVYALNSVRSPEEYEYVKKFLFNLSEKTIRHIFLTYYTFRSQQEGLPFPLKDNENMYYHVHWHNTIRQPMRFSPRQLYFNHKESAHQTGDLHHLKASGDDIIKEKIEKWKEEGLLPADYQPDIAFKDESKAFRNRMKSEYWKKKPKFLSNPRYGGEQGATTAQMGKK